MFPLLLVQRRYHSLIKVREGFDYLIISKNKCVAEAVKEMVLVIYLAHFVTNRCKIQGETRSLLFYSLVVSNSLSLITAFL